MHEPLPLGSIATNTAPAPWHVLHRDYETRGRVILKKVGTHRYAADSNTEILCVAYAVDDDPVQLWIPGNPVPLEFTEAARNPRWVVAAHSDHFEAAIEQLKTSTLPEAKEREEQARRTDRYEQAKEHMAAALKRDEGQERIIVQQQRSICRRERRPPLHPAACGRQIGGAKL